MNRRETLKLLAASVAAGGILTAESAQAKPYQKSAATRRDDPLLHLLTLPRSRVFGLRADGEPLLPGGLYRASTPNVQELSFDLSNQQIAASLTCGGAIRRAVLCTGLEMLPAEKTVGGIYSVKHLRYAGSCSVEVSLDDGSSLRNLPTAVSLVANHLPLFSSESATGRIAVSSLFLTPEEEDSDELRRSHAPRAILQTIYLENRGPHASVITLRPTCSEEPAMSGSSDDFARYRRPSALLKPVWFESSHPSLDSLHDPQSFVSFAVEVPPGTTQTRTLMWIFGEDSPQLLTTEKQLRELGVAEWFARTVRARTRSYGNLTLAGDEHTAELIPRLAQVCKQSVIRQTTGDIAGGFLGSDVDLRPINWVRDNYYSMLAASLFAPELCADSIPYFLDWGQPAQATGRGLRRMPNASGLTQSLANSLSGAALAGAYYRSTGDAEYFRKNPSVYDRCKKLLDHALATRVAEPMLFPSLYVSDGDARGDFNTGANVIAWFAFVSLARIAEEVFQDRETALHYAGVGAAIKRDLEKYCTGLTDGRPRFFEGANLDGTLIEGHDGEESDMTLMSFYGFCTAGDERASNHARMAMDTRNPFYSEALDAVWWYNDRWKSATFPAFVTALASTRSVTEQADRIARIGSLTDVDGSFWWWPYRYGSTDRKAPLRADGARKCGWAAGTYLCLVLNNIMGIKADVPSRHLLFAPDMPWDNLTWRQMRLGSATFDLSLSSTDTHLEVRVTNRNKHLYSFTLSLGSPAYDSLELLKSISDKSVIYLPKHSSEGRNIAEAKLLPMREVIFTFKKTS